MNLRAIIFVLFALVFAGGAVYVARSWLHAERAAIDRKGQVAQSQSRPRIQVLVAKRSMPAGTIVGPDDLRWQSWPEGPMPDSYVRNRGEDAAAATRMKSYFGAVVRSGLARGEPVTGDILVKPGERGFLAAVLHPGMRAVAVPVSATTAAAGFIFPGDRVDLVLTHTIKKGKQERRASETVLVGIRVLAIDQQTDDQEAKAHVAKHVTLEVTPKQVEIINVARSLGQLSLSLRALARRKTEGGTVAEVGKHLIPVLAAGVATDGDGADIARDGGSKANPAADNFVPRRGTTHTVDSEVSRLMGRDDGERVTIVRGRAASTERVSGGSDARDAARAAAAAARNGVHDTAAGMRKAGHIVGATTVVGGFE